MHCSQNLRVRRVREAILFKEQPRGGTHGCLSFLPPEIYITKAPWVLENWVGESPGNKDSLGLSV